METPGIATRFVIPATVVLFALLTGALPACSQGFSFGFKTGLNVGRQRSFSKLSGGYVDVSAFRIGVNIGVYGTQMFTSKLGMQAELQYSGEGGAMEGNTVDRLKLDYVNIPVLFRFQPSPMFHLEAGPQLGTLISAVQDDQNVKRLMVNSEFAVLIGGGFDFGNGIGIGLRFIDGLTDNTRNLDYGSHIRNFTTQCTIGYTFRNK